MRIEEYLTSSGRKPVIEFIKSLPQSDQERFIEIMDGIKQDGMGFSKVQFRQLAGKLWEIKYTAPGGGYRIAYVLIDHDHMVLLHAFKKMSKKSPPRDLALALKRMKEVLNHEKKS